MLSASAGQLSRPLGLGFRFWVVVGLPWRGALWAAMVTGGSACPVVLAVRLCQARGLPSVVPAAAWRAFFRVGGGAGAGGAPQPS